MKQRKKKIRKQKRLQKTKVRSFQSVSDDTDSFSRSFADPINSIDSGGNGLKIDKVSRRSQRKAGRSSSRLSSPKRKRKQHQRKKIHDYCVNRLKDEIVLIDEHTVQSPPTFLSKSQVKRCKTAFRIDHKLAQREAFKTSQLYQTINSEEQAEQKAKIKETERVKRKQKALEKKEKESVDLYNHNFHSRVNARYSAGDEGDYNITFPNDDYDRLPKKEKSADQKDQTEREVVEEKKKKQ